MADYKLHSHSLAVELKRHVAFLVLLGVLFLTLTCLPVPRELWGTLGRVILGILLLGDLVSLIVYVYRPIRKMEEAMKLLTRGEQSIFEEFKPEKDSVTLSIHLHELIEMLKQSLDREYTSDLLKKEAELKALQSQINPHFLYNVLDAIRGHALTEGVPEIAEMTEALSNLFRYSVSYWENEVSLKKELGNVASFFKIQQYRFNNKFDLQILAGEDEEETLKCLLPKLTLQPIIENSIYHGLEMKLDHGLVTIRTRLSRTVLLVEISDDGVGMPAEMVDQLNSAFRNWRDAPGDRKNSRGSGIALANVNSRIKMMYGEDYGLHVYSTENFGTTVEIQLPVNKEET